MPAKLSYEEVKKYVEENSDCMLLSTEYINSTTNLIFRCGCGKTFTARLGNFKSKDKRRCNDCGFERGFKKFTLTDRAFRERLFGRYGVEYSSISEYVKSDVHVRVRHNVCGHEYDVLPGNILNGRQCPICIGRYKHWDTVFFKQKVFDLTGVEYQVLGEYVRSSAPVLMKHVVCGHEYSPRPNDFMVGRRCPVCRESRGERRIRDVLDSLEVHHASEYTFKDLLGGSGAPLRFDFAIFTENEDVLLIEYDGVQHFQSNDYFGGQKALERTQELDAIKNNYCNRNNIRLIRIPYWEFDNIETILKDALL